MLNDILHRSYECAHHYQSTNNLKALSQYGRPTNEIAGDFQKMQIGLSTSRDEPSGEVQLTSEEYELLRLKFAEKDAEASYNAENDYLIVDARDSEIDDSDLVLLARYPNISFLHLARTSVTTAGLFRLGILPKLDYLNINETRFNSDCLEFILQQSRLSGLGLAGLKWVNDLSFLKQLPHLECVWLDDTEVSTDSIRDLVLNTKVNEISLCGTGLKAEFFQDLDNPNLDLDDARQVKLIFFPESKIFLDLPR
jgi:hypothetical protein